MPARIEAAVDQKSPPPSRRGQHIGDTGMNAEERAVFGDIGRKGLWENNTALVQLLGLCPLLAVSSTLVNAVSLSLATVLVMALASGAVAALRTLIPHEIRIPVFILIIAALVTCLDLAFNAWLHDLYLVLGIFIPPTPRSSASLAHRTASITTPAELGLSQTSSFSSMDSGTSPKVVPSRRMCAHFRSVSQGT